MEQNNKKQLYDQKIIAILNKEKLEKNDFVLLGMAYSQSQKVNDIKYKELETKRLQIFAKNHPEYAKIITNIIDEYCSLEQKENKQNLQLNIYNEVQEIVNNAQQYLGSENLNDKTIEQYIQKIQFKIYEIGSLRNTLSELDFNKLNALLIETLNNCEQTIYLLNEENNTWTR